MDLSHFAQLCIINAVRGITLEKILLGGFVQYIHSDRTSFSGWRLTISMELLQNHKFGGGLNFYSKLRKQCFSISIPATLSQVSRLKWILHPIPIKLSRGPIFCCSFILFHCKRANILLFFLSVTLHCIALVVSHISFSPTALCYKIHQKPMQLNATHATHRSVS